MGHIESTNHKNSKPLESRDSKNFERKISQMNKTQNIYKTSLSADMKSLIDNSADTTCTSVKTKNSESVKIVRFEWNQGGKEVYLIGSFSNWKDMIPMNLDSNKSLFYCEIVIPFKIGSGLQRTQV